MMRYRKGDGERSSLFTRRALLLGGAQAVLLSALAGRLYQLQVIETQRFATLAEENRINLRLLPPSRGLIFDRTGQPLAVNRNNFRAMATSDRGRGADVLVERLDQIFSLGETEKVRLLRELRRSRNAQPVVVRENLGWEEVARLEFNAPDLPGVFIDLGQTRDYPEGELMSHIIGYTGRVADEDLAGRDDPVLQLATMRFGKKGVERALEDSIARPRRRRAGRGQRRRPRRARARPHRGPARLQRAAHHRSRPAALRRRAREGAPERLGRGDGRRHRRHPGHGVDAGLRSQHLRPRHHPGRMARAARQSRAAAAQQVDRRRLSAGLDLQDGDGAGGAGIQGDRAVDAAALHRPSRARQHQVPLLAEGRPRLDQRGRGDRPVLRLLLLRGRPQGRHRPHRRCRRPPGLRPHQRARPARRIGRHPAQPRLEAGEARQALAARRHLQSRHRPGLHECRRRCSSPS